MHAFLHAASMADVWRHAAGVCTDPPMIIMEYCQRGSLYDVLKQAAEVQVS